MDYASDISIPTKKEASASFNGYELATFYMLITMSIKLMQ
jgi:hypothetical protein